MHQLDIPSIRAFWESQEKASAPIVLLRTKLGEPAWADISAKVLTQLERQFGTGPLNLAGPHGLG